MGQHPVLPLPGEEMKDLFFCPAHIEVPTADRDETTVPEDLVGVMALSWNRESAAVVSGKNAPRSFDKCLSRTLARTLRRRRQDSGSVRPKARRTRSSKPAERHDELTRDEVERTRFGVDHHFRKAARVPLVTIVSHHSV